MAILSPSKVVVPVAAPLAMSQLKVL